MNHPVFNPESITIAPGVEQEDQFRLLVSQVKDYAIFVLDPRGIVSSWNAGAERIKGYAAHEIIGHHFSRFYQEEAIRAGWPQRELELATRDGRFEDEGWRVRKDGSRFWANVVITALRNSNGTLRGFAKITRDLSERRRMERLEADARQVSEFVAMLAHELRNPLSPIRNAVALGKRSIGDVSRIGWSLDVIERQTNHLTRLVDDLLDMSRITRGRIRLERRRLSLREIVATAVEAMRPTCDDKQHTLNVAVDGDPLVRGDLVRLTQVLGNLLGNACKYTPKGGRIDIELTAADGRGRIAVRDTGIGISPDVLPRVFDMFIQETRSLDRSAGGLGLGLAIAHRLISMHGGTISAHSAGPGCGSEFIVELPLLDADEAQGTESAARLRVLIVDDNVDAANTMQALLESCGHAASVAFDGEAAIKAAQQQQPDLMLIDIGLPGINGYDVARMLRRLPELESATLVAITGYGTEEDRRLAMEAGFDHHLAKPVDFEDLLLRLPQLAGYA